VFFKGKNFAFHEQNPISLIIFAVLIRKNPLAHIYHIRIQAGWFELMSKLGRKILPFTVVLLLISNQIKAEDPSTIKTYYDATEITIGGENNAFVPGEGESLHILAGQSVRLLPGTHLVAGVQVVIETGKEVSKVEESKEYKSVLKNPELLISEFNLTTHSSFNTIPDSQSVISSSWGLVAIVSGISGTHSNFPVKHINLSGSPIQYIRTAVGNHIFTPDFSWGSRPENIKVLRT